MANTLDIYAPEMWWRGTIAPLVRRTVLANIAYTEVNQELKEMGDTVNLQIPGSFSTNSKTEGGDVTVQSITGATNVAVVLDKYEEVTFNISSKDLKRSATDLVKTYMTPAAEALARKVETDGMLELLNHTRLISGTPASTPDAMDDIADVNRILDEADAFDDERHLILGTAAYSKMIGTSDFFSADTQGNESTLRSGQIGTIFDTNIYKSRYVDAVVNPAFGAGPFAVDNAADEAAGETTIHIDGLALSKTPVIKAGTIINIAHTTGGDVQYVVTADADSDGSGDADIIISPALEYQADDDDVVTFLTGATATTFVRNVALHPHAIAFASRSLVGNGDNPGAKISTFNYNGIALTAVVWYNATKLAYQVTLSICYGWKYYRPDFSAMLVG